MKKSQLIQDVESKLGYRFKNPDLISQAFTRSSYAKQFGKESNEVIEFIGDKVLDLMVIKIITDRFGFMKSKSEYYDPNLDDNEFCVIGHQSEADFTEKKKALVSNENLASCIDRLGYAKYLRLGDSDINNDVEEQTKAKGDLFEGLVGAVTIDCNWNNDVLEKVIFNMLNLSEAYFDTFDIVEKDPTEQQLDNPISTLKEIADKGYCTPATYDFSNEAGILSDGTPSWSCTCQVHSWGIKKTAYATSKKEAKKQAAYLVLCERYHIPVK